jgi:hypothetical protein
MSNNRLENNNKTNGGNIDGGAPYKPKLFDIRREREQEDVQKSQDDMNLRNDIFVASLDEDKQAKFKAISDAMEILTKNNITAYVFPTLPINNEGYVGVHQYNNVRATCGIDPNKVSHFMSSLYYSLFAQIFVPLSEKFNKSIAEILGEIYNDYYLDAIKNKFVQPNNNQDEKNKPKTQF